MIKRKLEELNLLDDFLFSSVINYPEIGEKFAKELLKVIFGREFGSLKVIAQKVYNGGDTDLHGARTMFLYTRGNAGNPSEELRQFLRYMEYTTAENAKNGTLAELHQMVEKVKQDGEVSLEYMKIFEREEMLINQGREEERANTERERKRAEAERERAEAEKARADAAEKELEILRKRGR